MSRRPRDIGTAAETEVLRAFHRAGLLDAHRTALAGAQDLGDLHAAGARIVIEVKAGTQTRAPSWAQLAAWWDETQREASRVLACDVAVLVLRRHGSGRAEDWPAHLHPSDLATLLGADPAVEVAEPAALRLGALLPLLVARYAPEVEA